MGKPITLEDFKIQCNKKHQYKYDYSKVSFTKVKDKISIICPIHGEFIQTAWEHKNGSGCPLCAREEMSNRNTSNSNDFISKARIIHGNKYDYSKVEYVNCLTKVCIICPIHGEFWQTPNTHLNGCGCSLCVKNKGAESKRLTTEKFIERAIKVHGNKYDYSKVEYKDIFTPVIIIFSKHGEFWQVPNAHINEGKGCRECAKEANGLKRRKYTQDEFIKHANEIHANKYNYSQVEYTTLRDKVCIICPEHGEFWQTPEKHLHRGQGCPKCGVKLLWDNRGRRTTEEFIEMSQKVHGDKYDYSQVKYEEGRKKVCIICPIHGEFWKTPNKHLLGQGCPICSQGIDVMSDKMGKMLQERYSQLTIIREYCDKNILGLKRIDYFIKECKIAIEYQGRQHFHPVNKFGGYEALIKQIKLDKEKYKNCQDNNINLLYFTFTKRDVPTNYIDKVYTDFEELCAKIDEIISNTKE